MTSITDQFNSGTLSFTRWDDPVVDDGFDTYSDDILVYLTPILGPTSVLLLHRIGWYHAAGVALWIADVDQLASTFGVARTQLRQTLLRLENFGMVAVTGDYVAVRTRIPRLPRRWQNRYPAQLRDICPWWV